MLVLILFVFVGAACEDYPFRDPKLPWDKRVDDIISRLTLEEIANQTMTGYRIPTEGVTRLGINKHIWFSECIHGQMLTNSTAFPQSLGLAASFSKALLEKVAEAIATEVRAHWNVNRAQGLYKVWYGVSCFSPEMNLMRHPLWGRNQETYGEDPFLTGSMSVSYVQGLQGRHPRYVLISSGCKAFDAYNGPENIPVSRFTFDAKITERDLRMTFLPAFKMCVEGGTYNIMCSYNSVNGVPSCVNKRLLTDILRKEWGFKGYVVSDDGAINAVWKSYKLTKSAAETSAMAIKAGCNLELGDDYIYGHQVEAVQQGLITEDELRDNTRPLFYTRLRLGEFDPEEMNPYNSISADVVQSAEHRKLAMHAAMMTFVLLKNSQQLLPLRQTYKNIAIVGPMADNAEQVFGNYSPNIMPEYTVTPYKGLLGLADKVSYAAGCDNTVCAKYEASDISRAVTGSELVVVCLGTGPAVEQEDNDRSTLDLPGHQLQLLQDAVAAANGVPVILLLFNAGPVDITWPKYNPHVHAIVECFFPAQSAGSAIFHMLTASAGPQSVPAARLPSTWPASLAQVPPMTSYSMENRTYRYAAVEALYPFGYGLSYSHFHYSGLTVQPTELHFGGDLTIAVKVINLGPFDADEVIQVYISWPHAAVPVPRLQLVDFTRLTLAVYESHGLEFIIPWQRLAVWVDNVGFTVPQGDMQVFVGGQQPFQATHADSNVLQATFSVLY